MYMSDFYKKLPERSIIDWCEEHWNKNSITAPEMDDKTAIEFLAEYLLYDGFYIGYSCNHKQANTEIVCQLIKDYSQKYKNELKARNKIKETKNKIKGLENKIKEIKSK